MWVQVWRVAKRNVGTSNPQQPENNFQVAEGYIYLGAAVAAKEAVDVLKSHCAASFAATAALFLGNIMTPR